MKELWIKINRFLRTGKSIEALLHFCVMATIQLALIVFIPHKWILVIPWIVAFVWEWGGVYFENKKFSGSDFMFTIAGGYFSIFLLWEKIF